VAGDCIEPDPRPDCNGAESGHVLSPVGDCRVRRFAANRLVSSNARHVIISTRRVAHDGIICRYPTTGCRVAIKPNQKIVIALPVIALAAFASTWLVLRESVPEPDAPTAEVLEAAAETWWQPESEVRGIPESKWPPELTRLGPKSVRITSEGVFISFGALFVEEQGLFILPAQSDFQPQHETDPSFNLIRGRVYKYQIKG